MPDAILVADDEVGVRESLGEVLRDEGYEVVVAADGAAALQALDTHDFAVVLTDLRMPGADGLAVLRRTRETSPQAIVLIMTAHATVETAVEALRRGATDYILKPILFDGVLAKVAHAIEHRTVVWEAQMLRREVEQCLHVDELVGDSPAMREVTTLIEKVAPTTATVLLTGESGTGKEVVARAIHQHGATTRIFLPVNCAAIPEPLLESQLFGHVRGAFTGAVGNQEGLFSRASGGTIFLDEIGDLPLGLQSKLLRAIETKEILPVGSVHPRAVDVRIIAATNQHLEDLVDAGRFRPDLFYRLNVVEIRLPPVRERHGDIPALVDFLVRRHNHDLHRRYRGVDSASLKIFMAHPWKGNVRELDNVIEHAMIVGDGEWITPVDFPRSLGRQEVEATDAGEDLRGVLRAYERVHIETILRRCQRDKRAAAERLGLSLSSLYRKMNELDLPLD